MNIGFLYLVFLYFISIALIYLCLNKLKCIPKTRKTLRLKVLTGKNLSNKVLKFTKESYVDWAFALCLFFMKITWNTYGAFISNITAICLAPFIIIGPLTMLPFYYYYE